MTAMAKNSDLLASEAPKVDETHIRSIHDSLRSMPDVRLDPDPLASGPQAMNNKRAQISNLLGRCTAIELQLLEDHGWYKRQLTREQAKYRLLYTDLIAHNPHVRAGRSEADRKAAADVILADQVTQIDELVLAVEDLERLILVVKTKKADLKNLQSQLREQMKTCEHELSLGARWGQKGFTMFTDAVRSEDLDSVDDLIRQADETVETKEEASLLDFLGEPIETEDMNPSDLLPGTSSSEEVSGFFQNLGEEEEKPAAVDSPSTPQDVDLDDLLNGLVD